MRFILLIFSILFFSVGNAQNSFLNEQMTYERVRKAKENHHESLRLQFEQKGLSFFPQEVYLRAFKFDRKIEVWVKPFERDSFILLKTYAVCEMSGSLGPKRKQGDLQIPEGLYHFSTFNPVSNYHLSIKVNYPNASDRILGDKSKLGGDIFVHGKCATIGCLPIEDDQMEEIYWLSVLAKSNGAKLPIHIFPFPMEEGDIMYFKSEKLFDDSLWTFWMQLKPFYDYFEQNRKLPAYDVLKDGRYSILTRSEP